MDGICHSNAQTLLFYVDKAKTTSGFGSMNYAIWQDFHFGGRMETSVSPVSFHKAKVKTDFLKSLKSTGVSSFHGFRS